MTEVTIRAIDSKVSKLKKRKLSVSPLRSGGLVVAGAQIARQQPLYSSTVTTRAVVVGRPFLEVLPDNPDNPLADGVSSLYASLQAALDSRRPNTTLAKPLFSPLAGYSYDQFVRGSVTSST